LSTSALVLEGISKRYHVYASPRDRLREAFDLRRRKHHVEVDALSDINLEVSRGDVLGVVGKNGAGKSTLLKVIAGLIQPSSGNLFVNGEVSSLLDLGGGMNFEQSGRENAYFLASLDNSGEDLLDRVEAIVEFAQIGDMIDQPVKYYSHGMRARVAFAAATSINPDILIVDEVLAVGDSQFQRRCYARMELLMSQGTTVLFVSHDNQSVVEFCRRAIALHEGKLVDDGKPVAVVQRYLRRLDQQLYRAPDLSFELHKEQCADSDENEMHVESDPNDTVTQEPTAWLDPDLVVTSFSEVSNGPVCLRSIRLLSSTGGEINTFSCGEVVAIEIEMIAESDVESVVLPVSIKTKKGVEVCGVRYPNDKSVIKISAGTTVFNAKFRNVFLAGEYFITIGVTEVLEAGKNVMYRADDCGAFRVTDDGDIVRWGLFDLAPIWDVEQSDE
jgi:homopolymeric O-antigen transport system ATP-binding protein